MFIAQWKVEQNNNLKNHTTIQQEMGIPFGNCHYITCKTYLSWYLPLWKPCGKHVHDMTRGNSTIINRVILNSCVLWEFPRKKNMYSRLHISTIVLWNRFVPITTNLLCSRDIACNFPCLHENYEKYSRAWNCD